MRKISTNLKQNLTLKDNKNYKMKKILFTLILTISCISMFSQWTVQTVPDPKAKGNYFVSNPDDILTVNEVNYIDSIILEVQDSSRAEIAVVMLQSIGDHDVKTFATNLFNTWKVGQAETNNGLLILFVMDQRKISFETGYGAETILPDGKCYDIQQEYMVPRFKEGNYGQGMIDGIKVIVDIFMNRFEEITPEASNSTTDNTTNYSYKDEYNYDYDYSYSFRDDSFLNLYLKIILVVLALFFILLLIAVFIKDYFIRYQLLRVFKLYIWFIFFPVPFIGIYFWVKHLTEKWRNAPRISAKTGKVMYKLSEEDDNEYLKKGQIAEEKVKSVDYDVWVSGEEGDVLIQAYKRWFSKYNSCPKCKFKTYYKVYDKVITAATYTSSGKGERFYKCTNCGHSKRVTYTIPKKTKTSSTSSRSSSWGSSSSSWSSGSSYSSGSSWGGGSSGGGGATSSW